MLVGFYLTLRLLVHAFQEPHSHLDALSFRLALFVSLGG